VEELTNQRKIKILEDELKTIVEQEYILVIRGQAAKKLGNQARLDIIQKALEDTANEIVFLKDEIKKLTETEK